MPVSNVSQPYAAITLGSNSFNMLVAQTVGHKPTVIAKYKRKVRLAEGIGDDGYLSEDVMLRGLDCLAMFASMLEQHHIASDNVAVFATATLRVINNADEFHRRALPILLHPIEVISGLREAELIYQGMVATTQGDGRRLVIDIGGASTEFIIGDGSKVLFKTSVPMGCVLFNQRFFNQYPLQNIDFEQAIEYVNVMMSEHLEQLLLLGWQAVLGASGAVQSVVSVLQHRQCSAIITQQTLLAFKAEILAQHDASLAGINGLDPEQAPTFAAGVAILIALFESLSINSLHLAGGALREGVLQLLADRIAAKQLDKE
ncbi:Ppx/GppA phosphatase family protein [Shewanella metallivivens]|uniref:Exopolyphosphatase n=1 Tax=Shewanella metallivivens TaxID=2872342 RepID=A0ABT5TR13_9GAMM|nr:exopolyphosphatase [Shewanella metallivivens]MDD8061062.1 exopolyphosphatase [Shewanella metallivivens]